MAVKREKIKFESVEELLGAPVTGETTVEIEIDHITPFKSHPFKVIDDSKMEELVKSIFGKLLVVFKRRIIKLIILFNNLLPNRFRDF